MQTAPAGNSGSLGRMRTGGQAGRRLSLTLCGEMWMRWLTPAPRAPWKTQGLSCAWSHDNFPECSCHGPDVTTQGIVCDLGGLAVHHVLALLWSFRGSWWLEVTHGALFRGSVTPELPGKGALCLEHQQPHRDIVPVPWTGGLSASSPKPKPRILP